MQSYRGLYARKPVLVVLNEVKNISVFFSYRDYIEYCDSACSKFRYETIYLANNQDFDQTARMRQLVCGFVVRKLRRQLVSLVDNLQVSIV